MAERSRSSFKTQYTTNSGSYPFRDNTTKAITPTVMRTHSTDIPDSHVMFEDLAPITASGTDTYTAAASPTLPAYTNTRLWLVLFTNANTGAATLNIDSQGAKAITKNGTIPLIAGDITAGSVCLLAYDGTRFQIVGKHANLISSLLNLQTSSTGNVGTGEDTLFTYEVPAGQLGTTGASLEVFCAGTFASNANNKRLRLKFEGTTIMDSGALAATAGGAWTIQARIIRTGAATQKCIVTLVMSSSGGAIDPAYAEYTASTETLANALDIIVTGEATSDDDIVGEMFRVKYDIS